jgi:hypothetical protein
MSRPGGNEVFFLISSTFLTYSPIILHCIRWRENLTGKESKMKSNGVRVIAATLATLGIFTVSAWASNGPGERGECPAGPPPEAVVACKGKSEGASVEFTNRHGDTMKGICRQIGVQLAAMPDRPGGPKVGSEKDSRSR